MNELKDFFDLITPYLRIFFLIVSVVLAIKEQWSKATFFLVLSLGMGMSIK